MPRNDVPYNFPIILSRPENSRRKRLHLPCDLIFESRFPRILAGNITDILWMFLLKSIVLYALFIWTNRAECRSFFSTNKKALHSNIYFEQTTKHPVAEFTIVFRYFHVHRSKYKSKIKSCSENCSNVWLYCNCVI